MSAREGQPKGYVTQEIRRRVSRPLHARREEMRAEAEAAFKPKPIAETGIPESKK